jgi:hypothetical protein
MKPGLADIHLEVWGDELSLQPTKLSVILARAWQAANDKARELAWLV